MTAFARPVLMALHWTIIVSVSHLDDLKLPLISLDPSRPRYRQASRYPERLAELSIGA